MHGNTNAHDENNELGGEMVIEPFEIRDQNNHHMMEIPLNHNRTHNNYNTHNNNMFNNNNNNEDKNFYRMNVNNFENLNNMDKQNKINKN
jgi:hypothetical protein